MDAIQFCVDLDIPLRTFPTYTNESVPWICYKELVTHGTELVEEKIQIMQQRLSRLKAMQKEIERSESSYSNSYPDEYDLPERFCMITPYAGTLNSPDVDQLIRKLILKIFDSGMKLGNINGLLLLKKKKSGISIFLLMFRVRLKSSSTIPRYCTFRPDGICVKKLNTAAFVKCGTGAYHM